MFLDFLKPVFLVSLAVALYLLPMFVADHRQHPQKRPIMILTLLGGWTVLGWIAALAWACTAVEPQKAEPPRA